MLQTTRVPERAESLFFGAELTAFPVTFSKTAPPTRKMVRSSAGPRTNPPGAKYHPNRVAPRQLHELGRRREDEEDAKMPADPTRFARRASARAAPRTRRGGARRAWRCARRRGRVWTMDAAQDMDYATAVGASEYAPPKYPCFRRSRSKPSIHVRSSRH